MRYLVCRVMEENEQEKFKNPYSGEARVWHKSFSIAKSEAERLCIKEGLEFRIFAETASVKPATKTIFENYGGEK